ncbi:SGNH/GDSL hydrolase family protein [Neobacillus vireti]|uniref:SGNH/GDSL hydrolase family protein n=1 Tax=Neobacillus vireti TaxID=220686 RepID=UPI002FFFF362
MTLSNDFNGGIIGKRRTGKTDDPYKLITITLPVINSKTVLPEIPNRLEKVKVTGVSYPLYEIEDGELNDNFYRVDYAEGVVFFNAIHNNSNLTFTFLGEGQHFLPASSVWVTDNNGDIQTATEKLERIDADILAQKQRVDQQIQSTPQPSEIVDARVDRNGVVFPTVKGRVDAEQKKIDDALQAKDGTNYTSLKSRMDKVDDRTGDTSLLSVGTNLTAAANLLKNSIGDTTQLDKGNDLTEGVNINSTDIDTLKSDLGVAQGNITSLTTQANGISKKISYKEKQTELLSLFYDKLRSKQLVTIACQGDSLTYGYDVVSSDIRPADSSLTDDGTAHLATRASISYPEALQDYFNTVYGHDVVSIKNRGYSGDWVSRGLVHWNINPNANLHVISYGVNDSRNTNCPYMGDVVEFIKQYRILIERVLDWNSAIVLLLPLKSKTNRSDYEVKTDVFAEAARQLGKEYGIPVVDGEQLLNGYSAKFWSDGTHLNGLGYKAFAGRLFGAFIGDGVMNPYHIIDNSTVLANYQNYSFILKGTSAIVSSDGYPTPDSETAGAGYAVYMPDNTAEVYFGFYADKEDMIVIPSMYTSTKGRNVTVELDFGNEQAQNTIDYVEFDQNRIFTTEASKAVINTTDFGTNNIFWENDIRNGNIPYVHITSRGWHVIKVSHDMTNAGESLTLHGLYFKHYSNVFTQTGVYIGHTSYDFNDTTTILQSRVKWIPLLKQLGLFNASTTFYEYPLINIEVNNYGRSYDVYELQLYRGNDPAFLKFGGMVSRTTWSTANSRIITDITFDTTTDELIITWGGETNRAASYFFKVAGAGGNVKIYQPSTTIPAPIKGAVYFDANTNKLKKSVDGTTWVDFISNSNTFTVATLINGWNVYVSQSGDVYYYPAYMLDELGFVHIRGHMAGGTNNRAFTLPVGMRPKFVLYYSIVCGTNTVGSVTIKPDGGVFVNVSDNSFVSLCNIPAFLAEQ